MEKIDFGNLMVKKFMIFIILSLFIPSGSDRCTDEAIFSDHFKLKFISFADIILLIFLSGDF